MYSDAALARHKKIRSPSPATLANALCLLPCASKSLLRTSQPSTCKQATHWSHANLLRDTGASSSIIDGQQQASKYHEVNSHFTMTDEAWRLLRVFVVYSSGWSDYITPNTHITRDFVITPIFHRTSHVTMYIAYNFPDLEQNCYNEWLYTHRDCFDVLIFRKDYLTSAKTMQHREFWASRGQSQFLNMFKGVVAVNCCCSILPQISITWATECRGYATV